jgi:amidase
VLTHDPFLSLPIHPECQAALAGTVRLLETLGHIVEEGVYPPALEGPTGLGEALRIISSSGLAARLEAWGQRTGQALGPEDVEPATWTAAEQGRSYSAVQVHAAAQRLLAGEGRCPEWWAAGFDILVTPTLQSPPPRIGLRPEAHAAAFGIFTMPWSITGQPAISLPLHWTADGLPVGVQFVAGYGREDVLIRLGAQLERACPWAERRPTL